MLNNGAGRAKLSLTHLIEPSLRLPAALLLPPSLPPPRSPSRLRRSSFQRAARRPRFLLPRFPRASFPPLAKWSPGRAAVPLRGPGASTLFPAGALPGPGRTRALPCAGLEGRPAPARHFGSGSRRRRPGNLPSAVDGEWERQAKSSRARGSLGWANSRGQEAEEFPRTDGRPLDAAALEPPPALSRVSPG